MPVGMSDLAVYTPPATAAPAADDDAAAPAAAAVPPLFWAWGGLSIWLLIDGYLTSSAYTTLASTLVTAKVANNAAWTTTKVQGYAPISNWLLSANIAMFLQFVAVCAWIAGIAGQGSLFLLASPVGIAFPVIEMLMWMYTYFTYSACSGVTATQFDGTTTTVTQLSSCSGATSTTAITALYGPTGTTAAKVSTDPRSTWFFTNVASDLAMIAVAVMALPAFTTTWGAPAPDADADADAAPAANATAANATANATAPGAANATDDALLSMTRKTRKTVRSKRIAASGAACEELCDKPSSKLIVHWNTLP